MNNLCQIGNHKEKNIVSLCFSTKCKGKRGCCQNCIDQQHKDHTDQLTDLEYLLNYIKTESLKPSDLQPKVRQRLQDLQQVLNCLEDLSKLISDEMRKLSSMNIQQICKELGSSYKILSQDFQGLSNQKWNELIEDMLSNVYVNKCCLLQKDSTESLSLSMTTIQTQFLKLKQQLRRVNNEWFNTSEKLMEGHTDIVRGIDICKKRNLLASGSVDKSVKLWNLENNKLIKTFPYSGEVYDVVFTKEGNLLAFGGQGDYSIQLIDISDLMKDSITSQLSGHKGDIYRLTFCNDSQWLISSSKDNTIKIWNLNEKKEAFQLNLESEAHGIAISGDDTLLASNSEDGNIRIWGLQDRKLLYTEAAHNKGAGIQFSGDQQILVSSGYDGMIKLWNLEELKNQNKVKLICEYKAGNNCIWTVLFSSCSNYIISICNQDSEIKIIDKQTSDVAKCFISKQTKNQHLVSVTISQDVKIIAYGQDNNIMVWRKNK